MSSPKAKQPKTSAQKKKSARTVSRADKVAFTKAMYRGIAPNTKAARTVARKKSGKEPAVEILRRIPAMVGKIESEESAYAIQLAADIDKAIHAGDTERFSPRAQQELIGALCRLYAANNENENNFSVLKPGAAVSATEVMIMCGALLKAVDLQAFELGMWLSWSSR
jgi:hypothetical protein